MRHVRILTSRDKSQSILRGHVVDTNSKNLELYSVMAEYDGSGFPLSYCILSTASAVEPGKRTKALTEWASCLRDKYGVRPVFAHIDKDMAEISMLRDVWKPKIQLCWWHMENAVEDRLKKPKLSTSPYDVLRARSEFLFISTSFVPLGRADPTEHEGGSGGSRDHTGFADVPHQDGPGPNTIMLRIPLPPSLRPPLASAPVSNNCSAPLNPTEIMGSTLVLESTPSSRSTATPQHTVEGSRLTIRVPPRSDKENHGPEKFESDPVTVDDTEKTERRTFCPDEHRRPICDIIERHYCAHPLIPGYSSPTPEGIREWAVKQIYNYCVSHDLREVWAYLWENWYRQGRWELWARSCHPQIAKLKTTMILEAQ
jgi:hypothetical protein